MANDRLRALEDVEKEIAVVLQCAGTIVLELSKEKHNASLLDRQLNQFQTSINRIESELSSQIRYLTQKSNFKLSEKRVCAFSFSIRVKVATGQPHEGSTYSARKDCQMALNRAEYARVKLGELRRTCEMMLDPQT
ncbi:mediator of RNA polymerase II transcription subunit 11 [Clarias magur]|uniref:Mediator of RNA polymerase II transcription subunit 11 n=1 Tax=Clarias magur TaxID=1594786 RepID=A0A8J4U302_CLAMG|nr:mediator of RNA polymerase II transcription subunit 11 [Clarias magur]